MLISSGIRTCVHKHFVFLLVDLRLECLLFFLFVSFFLLQLIKPLMFFQVLFRIKEHLDYVDFHIYDALLGSSLIG
jgi:hypothetical protein